MKKKYTVYRDKDHRGKIIYVFGTIQKDGDIHPIFTFKTTQDVEHYIQEHHFKKEEILFAIEIEREFGK